jgi:hypothetical protein
MAAGIDPLADPELRRVLAVARAREAYPGLAAPVLLELADAAWQKAGGADGDPEALERFERALAAVARGYRAGAGRLSVSEVAEQAIPASALAPYLRPSS